jgi:hypothetical protein
VSKLAREHSNILRTAKEETLEIEYIPSALPPEQIASIAQPDWISSVSLKRKG